ncbi:MAG: aminopeptidase [Candidatus Woesearchaeota archaeon]
METSIEFGARQAIVNCIDLKKYDKLCIITDENSKEIADVLFVEAENITSNISVFVMEDYGKRDSKGINPLRFPDEMKDAILSSTVSIYCAGSMKNELKSFRKPMLEAVEKNEKLRHAHMPGITEQIMKDGMASDYAKIQEMSQKIYDVVKDAKEVHVTTDKGTDFTVELGFKWIISDGDLTKKKWTNLPDGEVFTCVKNINGKAVINGVLGDYFTHFGILDKTPLTLTFEDGYVKMISCENKKLEEEVKKYSRQDENANRIGEFAIGTNLDLKKLIGNLLQDEKFPGVHIAIGHGYPEKTGSGWNSDAHLDCVIPDTTIVVDGKKIMEKGKFLDLMHSS